MSFSVSSSTISVTRWSGPPIAIIPEKFAPLVFDGKLHLGMSRLEVVTALGPPSKSEAAQMVYSHDGKLADGFDETAWLILRFREEKLVSMRGGKTTTN